MKVCNACSVSLPLDKFHANARSDQGVLGHCTDCARSRRQAARARDRQIDPWRKARERYNLSACQLTRLRIAANDRCQICGMAETALKMGTKSLLSVDHDHGCCPGTGSCGSCVRGLLCNSCNNGLGRFKDDLQLMRSAVSYLEG